MSVQDLWAGKSKAEIADLRAKDAPRHLRRWREGGGREAPQRKQSYKERQRAQAYLDDASHAQSPNARRRRLRDSFGDRVVSTLTPTEIETWAARTTTAREPRKKRSSGA